MTSSERDEVRQQMVNEALAQQRPSTAGYGERQRINPYTALLTEVQYRAGHTAWIRDQITATLTLDTMFEFTENGRVDHPLLRRYDRERDRFDRVCKLAIDAGIAERYVQLAELQGETLLRVLEYAMTQAGITPEQKMKFLPALREAIAVEEATIQPTNILGT